MRRRSHKKPAKILWVLFIGVLMGALDISIVGPAIPSIEETIVMSEKALAWVFSIYILFNLSGISLMAKLSDKYGRRWIYILSVSIFALGSLVVAVANTYLSLLVGRAIQGFGSSGIFPVASAVIGDIFPKKRRGKALGRIGSVFGIAFIIGPLIAGMILKFFTWHYLFLINLPVAAYVIWQSYLILPDKPVNKSMKLDWKGMILLSSFLLLFAYTLYSIEPSAVIASLGSYFFIGMSLISIILLVMLIRSEKRVEDPIINLSFFKNRQLLIVFVVAMGTGIFEASFIFIPEYLVTSFNIDASSASFMLIPAVVSVAIGAPIWGWITDKYGSKIVIINGLILAGAGFILVSRMNSETFIFYTAGIFFGLGLSALLGSSLRCVALNEVSASERAASQGLMTIFISAGQILGSVVIGVIAAIGNRIDGFRRAYLYLCFLTVLLFLISFLLNSRKKELLVSTNNCP
jgi:EmrB/QacA subfamily drug resistance transporter